MNAQELLAQVHLLDAELIVVDGKLKVSPAGVLRPELKAAIRARAAEIKAHLSAEKDRITGAYPEPEQTRWPSHARAPKACTPHAWQWRL